jgi:crotonobetainyl-CoA:carnitine CoA-transferase CaiB-like acyl-CoA transferase
MGALSHLRVLDLSRVLAGPTAGQILADLGAEVIKVERPGRGDDTRAWGPPWLRDENGEETAESAYYLAANRGKKSVAIDFSRPEGQALVRELAGQSDVLLENFRVGSLARYGLDHASLAADHPGLIYCSITGFGQTGPYAERPGYDSMIQAMGGLMSVTGTPDGEPQKVGVALADVMSGLYAVIGVLAALAHRERSGEGQHIDVALLDVQISALVNQAMNYLVGGQVPGRMGNAHPNIVPYQVFATEDGYFMLAVGNDGQFRKLCELLGCEALADDERYATNGARVQNRDVLVARLAGLFAVGTRDHWLARLEAAGVPCGPVNRIDEVFADPQVRHRGMQTAADHPLAGSVPLVASPLKLGRTPPGKPTAPPTLGQHTREVLEQTLGLDAAAQAELREQGVIGDSA